MERAVLHRTNDSYRATNPADEHLGPEPEDEDAPEEPEIEELWDGGSSYIHVVTMRPSGRKFYIRQATSGAFVSDFEVIGKGGLIAEGFLSAEKAIDWLVSNE
jgi:hypothetical protein